MIKKELLIFELFIIKRTDLFREAPSGSRRIIQIPKFKPQANLNVSKKQEITIRLAGYSQDGIQSMGSLLAKLAGRSGYRVMTYMTIPATVAGGNSIYQLRIGNRSILTPGDEADVLVALYQDSLEAHISLLKAGGVLLCDSKHCQPEGKVPDGTHVYALPITDLLESALGGHAMKGKNMFLLGMLSRLLGLDDAKVEDLALERFRKKDESVIQNVRTALMAGLEYEWSGRRPDIHLDEAKHSCEAVTMDGNSAVAYGLISAGVRYGASYPITPATSIMEVLIEELPKYNGVFLQTEDELAAAAAAIGMSYGGNLAVTSTSGPGMSLKMECLGWATMAEMPLIVVDVQRGGPSTGIPTQVEQSDLLQSVYGSHGDAPRVVLAARDVEECFSICKDAAAIAKQYSTPVVILSDQGLSTRIEAFDKPDWNTCIVEPKLDQEARPADFVPYPADALTHHAPPGCRIESGRYPVMTGLEHDTTSGPNPGPANHMTMTAKRRKKFQMLEEATPMPEMLGDDQGDLLLISWGSSFGATREAVMRMEAEGRKASHMHLRTLYPLKLEIRNVLERFKRVYTVELNDAGIYGAGQLATLIRSVTGCDRVRSIAKTDGQTFKVREILKAVANA